MAANFNQDLRPCKRVLYVVTEDWYFLSHRLPMARAARDAGYEVHVATNVSKGAAAIEAEGFLLHRIRISRGRLSPLVCSKTILELRALHRRIHPDIVHHVALQPVILGCLAALDLPAAWVNALTGLGFIFTSTSRKARRLSQLMVKVLRFLLTRRNSVVLVQNKDDRTFLMSIGVPLAQFAIIPGSGVDVTEFKALPEPIEPLTVAFVGRLLVSKGVRCVVGAHKLLRARGSKVELLIAGAPDPANPDSLTQAEVEGWSQHTGITCLGHVDDVSTVWARAHIAVLPSIHEGMPKNLLEAAACGRPMVATDVPGCREIVRHGETGLLVPLDDIEALAAAIDRLARSSELRVQYGMAARRLAIERFSDSLIGRQTIQLYSRLAIRTNFARRDQ